jgi:hypothetical protein
MIFSVLSLDLGDKFIVRALSGSGIGRPLWIISGHNAVHSQIVFVVLIAV